MGMKDVILCMDRGTSELKVILFDQYGNNYGMEQRSCKIIIRNNDWLEADLEETERLLTDAVRSLMERTEKDALNVVCIAITSYMSGTIFLNESGDVAGPAVLWNDSRTQKLTEEWERNGTLECNFDLTGSQILTGWPIPLLSWWKQNDPELLQHSKYLLNMKDWLRYRLTGTINTDVTEAVLSPGDVRKRGYSDEVLELFDVYEYRHLLPPVKEPEAIAGYLKKDMAGAMNLPANIPVVIGIGDMPGGVLGTGVLLPGHGSSVLGTTFLNGLILDQMQMEPRNAGMTSAYVEGHILRMVNNTGGAAINSQWFINNFFSEEQKKYEKDGIYAHIDKTVESIAPGANGVMYHPYINSCGVTAPFLSIGARAQFTGIGLQTSKSDMIRAIYEGIGFAMRDCYSSVPVDLIDVTMTGGASKSKVLCQIVADVCNVPIHVLEQKEATALGAGICAAVGIGLYGTYAEAIKNMVHFSNTFQPNEENAYTYQSLYRLYFETRNAMRPAWDLRRKLWTY